MTLGRKCFLTYECWISSDKTKVTQFARLSRIMTCLIYSYPSISLEAENIHSVFISNFTYSYLDLFFILNMIYVQRSTKVLFYNWSITLNYCSICKIIKIRLNFIIKCTLRPWHIYMICLIYCFYFSVIATWRHFF